MKNETAIIEIDGCINERHCAGDKPHKQQQKNVSDDDDDGESEWEESNGGERTGKSIKRNDSTNF